MTSDDQLEIARLQGELHLLTTERNWWAEEMLFWRGKYLADHPDKANADYMQNARHDEGDGETLICL